MGNHRVRETISKAVLLFAVGFVTLFLLASLYSLVRGVIQNETAQVAPAQPQITQVVITAIIIGPVAPTPTVPSTPTPTPTMYLVPVATATPTVIVPRVPTVTPIALGIEPGQGLGGLIYGSLGDWLKLEGK